MLQSNNNPFIGDKVTSKGIIIAFVYGVVNIAI